MLYLNPRSAALWFGVDALELVRAVRRGETTLEYRAMEKWARTQPKTGPNPGEMGWDRRYKAIKEANERRKERQPA